MSILLRSFILQIWHVEIQVTGAVKVEFAADLQRHQRAVNVVRFSPSGEFLASADDGKLAFYLLCMKLKGSHTDAHPFRNFCL
jgi:hypothetical protein